ncbi:MAG: hypothetical protein J6W53_03620 [Candidatus Methanomethylophilaceae archaeon]|nr:hypothetical protein [Candidatus Methanomethylophilaceae archaeon]
METKDMNFLGIIAIVGALLMVIGVFLTWGSYDNILGETVKVTGMDFFNDKGMDGTKYTWVPLVALICGIISLLLMILPTFMNVEKFQQINNILGIVALILALLVIIFGILFATQSFTYLGTSHSFTYYYKLGIGYWFVIIGAVITFIGGIMPILKNKGIIKF